MTRKPVLSRNGMTNAQARDQVNLSEYAAKVIRDTERNFGQKLSTDGWGKIMDYLEDMIYDTKSDLSDGERKTKIEDYIYQIYESDIGIKDIYTAKSVKASRYSQAKAIVPEESKQRFCDLLDSLGIWYTTEVIQEGIEFTYGVSIGSKEFKKIDKFLDSVHSNIKGGTSIMRKKRFSVKASMSAKRRVLAMTDEEFYTREFPAMKAGEVKVKPHRGNYTVFIGLSDGTIAYQWCESKVAAEREAKYVRDIVKKYGSDDDYWIREGYRIWNPNVKSNKAVRCARTKDTSVSKEDVTELVQFIINRQEMDKYIHPVIANLKKHVAKGNYSADDAIKSWQRVADEGCAQYSEVFVNNRHSYAWLNPATRKEIAKQLQKYYDEQVFEDVEASKSVRCARTMRKRPVKASGYTPKKNVLWLFDADENQWVPWGLWSRNTVTDNEMYELNHRRFPNPEYDRDNNYTDYMLLPNDGSEPDDGRAVRSSVSIRPVKASTKRRFAVKASNVPESDVDELYRVANDEVLPTTELYKIAGICDIDDDTFDYTYTGTAFGAYLTYIIHVGISSSDIDLYTFMRKEWDSMFPDINPNNSYGNYVQINLDVMVSGDRISVDIADADVYEKDKYSEYYSKKFDRVFDTDAIEDHIKGIAEQAANKIQSVLSQYIPEDDEIVSSKSIRGRKRVSASKRMRKSIKASAGDTISIAYKGNVIYTGDPYDMYGALYRVLFKDANAKAACVDYLNSLGDPVADINDSPSEIASLLAQEIGYQIDDGYDVYENIGDFEIFTGASVTSANSIKCGAVRKDDSVDPIDSEFMVDLYYSPNHKGRAGDRYFYDWSEAESYAHDALMNGLYVSIWNKNNGDTLDVSPEEYNDAWENGAADFDINEAIVNFKRRIVESAKSIKCDDEIEDEITEDDSDLTIDISQLELSEPYYETREDDPENPDKWVLVIGKNPERHMNYKLWYYVDSTDADLTGLDLSNPDHIDIDEESTFEDYDDIQLSQDIKCSTVTDKYGNSVNLVTM